MAGQFPIESTGRSLPGRGPGALGYTGAMYEGAAIQEFGGALIGVGIVENRLQADTELAEAIMADRQAINDLAFRLEKNTDPHTYQEELNKMLGEIQSRQIKNGLAAREHVQWVQNMQPKLEKSVQEATNLRIKSNYHAQLFKTQTEYIQTSNGAEFQALLAEGVAANYIAEDKAAKLMFQVRHKSERRMLEETAMTDPAAALEFAKHFNKGDVVGFETIDSMDVRDIQSIAEGQQAFNERTFDEQESAAYGQVFAAAANPDITPPKMHQLLRSSNLPPKKQDELFQMYMRVWRNLKAGGSNPFTSTQNYPVLMQMQLRISAGLPTTEMDVWRAMLGDGTGPPRFSLNDARHLINKLPKRLDDADRAQRDYLNETETDIDEIFLAGKKIKEIPPETQQQWAIVRRDAERIIEKNWPNIGQAQKELEALLAPYKKKQSKGLLRWYADLTFPEATLAKWGMTEAEMYRGIGRWIGETGETKVGEPK